MQKFGVGDSGMASNADTDVGKLIAFGQMALEQGWYDQACDYFEQALGLDASNREAMKGLAQANEILSRRAAMAVEPTRGEPVEPLRRTARSIPEKRLKGQRRSPVQWFKSQSRLGKIAILASVPLVLCCLCVSLAIPAVFISLWNPFAPPTQPTVEIIPTITPALPTLAPLPTPIVPTQQPISSPVPTRTSLPTATPTPQPTQPPIIRIGDTIPEFSTDYPNLSLTLISWKESDIVIEGPYISGYYAFTAKPDMEFIVLTFRFQNNWIRPQETPYLRAGEVATDKGYFYPLWHPPSGILSEEYNPREATDYEIETLIVDSGGYEELLPEESTIGRVVFEIPEDETPVEASISGVAYLIKLDRK
jgi:hypothetical protein